MRIKKKSKAKRHNKDSREKRRTAVLGQSARKVKKKKTRKSQYRTSKTIK